MIRKINREYIFPLFVFVTLIIFSILFPMYQVPDELRHIQFTYEELGQDYQVYEDYCEYFDVVRMAGNPNEKINYKAYFNFDIKATSKLKLALPKITLIRHLPQALSILIGHLFNLPIIVIVLIGEVLASLTYAFACFITLKLLPFKKIIMKFIMLLPILIQQMGSFSYDVMLISLSFIFIAYIMNLKFNSKKITNLEVIKILLLIVLIALIKIPYILLGMLTLLLPIKKLDLKIFKLRINEKFINKNKKLIIISLIFMIILGIFIMSKVSIGRTLLAFFINPIGLIKVLFLTLKSHGTGFIYTLVGNLGWLDIKTSILFCIFVFLSGLIFNFFNYENEKTKKQPFKKIEVIYLVLLFIFLCIIIMLSLFEWTLTTQYLVENYSSFSISDISKYILDNNFAIDGIQGRYFVPLLPIICLPIFNEKVSSKLLKYSHIYEIIYFSILIIYLFITVLFRYWI